MENDYISLSEAQDAMTAENLIRNLDDVENGEAKRYARAAIRVLEQIEPADVQPVVYCRDCSFDDKCFAQSILKEMSRIPFDKNKFFCADGKRREGGADGCC